MAKTLNQFLEGYLKVKSADEQKFIDKHVTVKNPDRNGNGDDVFKGKTKPTDRRKERHGYEPGDDEKVYEALKGGQKNIDANHNGKLDAHDFHLLRKKKKVAEEADQIDELSEPTVRTYYNKAGEQGKKIADKMKMGGGDWSKDGSDTKTLKKRAAGRTMALKRRSGEMKMSEAVEELDELSVNTMKSYRDNRGRTAFQGGGGGAAINKKKSGQINSMGLAKTKIDRVRNTGSTIKEEEIGLDETKALSPEAKEFRARGRAQTSHYNKVNKLQGKTSAENEKRMAKEEADISEVLTAKTPMGTYVKDFQKSNAPQFKGRSPEKRRVMAIAAKLSAERGGKPLNKEERLQNRLTDISESQQRTMMTVFEKLNDDNKSKFLEACDTPEGVEQMLDFAINNRGE